MKRFVARAALALVFCGLAAGLVLVLTGALYTPDLTIPTGYAGKHIAVNGLALRVLQQGSGRDILFIHGSPGSIEDATPIIRSLGAGFRVTAYDRPGHGFSADGGQYSLAYNAQLARALIEQLKLEHVIVVGHSYGGSTALALALLGAPRVSAYVLLDSAVYRPVRPAPPLFRVLALPVLGEGLARLMPESLVKRKVAAGLATEFAPRSPPPGFTAQRSQIWIAPKIVHALANEQTSSGAELVQQSAHYREIEAPLYIVSQRANAARRENAEKLQREVRGAALQIVPNSGHYVQFEATDAVVAMIRRAAGITLK